MKSSSTVFAFALLFSLLSQAAAASAPRKTDARQLLRLAETGLSDMVQAAQVSEGRIDPARSEQRPFWTSIDQMDAALRRVREEMVSRDPRFFRSLEEGSAILGELRVVWARMGVADPGVSQGLRILSSSFQLLRSGYGREAVRHRQGGGLTEAELQRFRRIQRAQERFAEHLRHLQALAQQRKDEALAAELRRMEEEARRIAAAQATLEAYLNALLIGDIQRGEWTGNSRYAGTTDRSAWLDAGAVVEELYVEQDVGHVFALDLGALEAARPSALPHLDEPTEVPASLAVEVFEPSETDLLEEEDALAEEEMEETAESELDVYEDIVETEEAGTVEPVETVETVETVEDTEVVEEGTVVAEELPAEAGETEQAGETVEAVEIIEVEDLPVQESGPADPARPSQSAPKKEPSPAPGKKAPEPSPKKSADPPRLS